MNRKRVNFLRFLSVLCIIALIGELSYIVYCKCFQEKKYVYFDGINAVVSTNKYYASAGSNNDNDSHYERAKISKYNLKKEKTFEKLYNVGYNSSFFGILLDGEDIVAVGSYEKTEDDHKDSVRRALIVKFDKKGNIVFEKDFQMLDNSKFTSITQVGTDYLVTGQSIYKNNKIGEKDGGAILVKYDKDGKLLWKTSYGSSKSAIFNDCKVINNYIYAVGTDENYLGIFVKYDLDGNFITYNDYKTTDSLGFSGIESIGDNIYISGALRRDNDDNDAMIVRYDLGCEYIDQVVYTGLGIERFNKLMVDDLNNLVAIGTMAIETTEDGVSEYNYDGIVAKYDANLKYVDSVSYGDERDDYFTDIIFVDDMYLVVGYSSYEDGSYMSKFIRYSKALKVLNVE